MMRNEDVFYFPRSSGNNPYSPIPMKVLSFSSRPPDPVSASCLLRRYFELKHIPISPRNIKWFEVRHLLFDFSMLNGEIRKVHSVQSSLIFCSKLSYINTCKETHDHEQIFFQEFQRVCKNLSTKQVKCLDMDKIYPLHSTINKYHLTCLVQKF